MVYPYILGYNLDDPWNLIRQMKIICSAVCMVVYLYWEIYACGSFPSFSFEDCYYVSRFQNQLTRGIGSESTLI